MTDWLVRPVQDDDLGAIVAIYNDVMQTSATIWREQPTTVPERREWLAAASRMGHPVLVATDASGPLGFIAAEPFRPWPGYAATCEHSVHVRRDARSRGVGACLLDAMETILRTRGIHIMVAGIDSENEGSLRFHARAGFLEKGYMPQVGRMRGSWRDLVLLQKTLIPREPGHSSVVSGETVQLRYRPTGSGALCQRILSQLPAWFGHENAVREYAAVAERSPTVVAAMGDDEIGLLTLVRHSADAAEISVMAVSKQHHRRGVARRLMREAESRLAKQGIGFLQVKTLSAQHPDEGYARTRAFYRSCGFRVLEELPDLWGSENPAVQMIKTVPSSTATSRTPGTAAAPVVP